MLQKMKTCTKCGEEKVASLDCFPPNKVARDRLGSWCRICYLAYQRSDKMVKYNKLYHKTYYKKYHASLKGYLVRLWNAINNRCNNPSHSGYRNYGGRGIKNKFVSPQSFRNHVTNILEVDPRGLQIDRIDNNGHYEPGNIRFVTQTVNANNKRNNVLQGTKK